MPASAKKKINIFYTKYINWNLLIFFFRKKYCFILKSRKTYTVTNGIKIIIGHECQDTDIIDLFTDTAAILDSIVFNWLKHYGKLKWLQTVESGVASIYYFNLNSEILRLTFSQSSKRRRTTECSECPGEEIGSLLILLNSKYISLPSVDTDETHRKDCLP